MFSRFSIEKCLIFKVFKAIWSDFKVLKVFKFQQLPCNTDYRAKIKNAPRRQQWRLFVKQGEKNKKINSTSTPKTPTSSEDVAQVMWHSLTPNAKRKIKLNVSNSSDPGMNEVFRGVIGANLSNQINIRASEMTPLQENRTIL